MPAPFWSDCKESIKKAPALGRSPSCLLSAPRALRHELSCHRKPGCMQPRAPTRQCQPVFLPWLQPGGLSAGPRACALAVRPARVPTIALRLAALTPTFAPTLVLPWAPMPIRCASALFAAAMESPAAATVTMSTFLHMQCLLFWQPVEEASGCSHSLPLLRFAPAVSPRAACWRASLIRFADASNLNDCI